MVIAGWARFGSSKVPTRTKIRCGRASASLKSGVPQSGQNRRCIRLPLSATLEKSLVLPTTLKVSVRKQAPTVPLPAPRYWQSRHQHARVVMGGCALSQRTAPQRHLPVTVTVLSKVGKRGIYVADRTRGGIPRSSNARRFTPNGRRLKYVDRLATRPAKYGFVNREPKMKFMILVKSNPEL
jgi:hypothetical protein